MANFLTADLTIYVRMTGNDTTGDGTLSTPYRTVERANVHLYTLLIGSYNVTVDIGVGHFGSTSPLELKHPYGGQIIYDGVCESATGLTTSNIDNTDTPVDTASGSLESYEVTFTSASRNLVAGDFVLIYGASGGQRPKSLQGCHEVVSYSGSTVTIRIVKRTDRGWASGTVTFNCHFIRTVLTFDSCNGMKADGPYHLGLWKDLVLAGDPDDSDCDYGIWLLNSPTIALGDTIGIHGWQRGIYAQNNSMAFADYTFISCCHQHGVMSNNGATINVRYANISGCSSSGIFAYTGATISANNGNVTGCGWASIYALDGSWIDFTNGYALNNHNGVIYADNLSGVKAPEEDVSVSQVRYESSSLRYPTKIEGINARGAVCIGGPY